MQLNLLTCNGEEGEGFDLIIRINVSNFAFLQTMPKLPPPRQVRPRLDHQPYGAALQSPSLCPSPDDARVGWVAQVRGVGHGGDFADKEFQSWLGSMDGDIQREIPK